MAKTVMRVGSEGASGSVAGHMRDTARVERLRTELRHAFAAPDSAYRPLVAGEVVQRNRRPEEP
jgi:antitoxin ParD1/3/4